MARTRRIAPSRPTFKVGASRISPGVFRNVVVPPPKVFITTWETENLGGTGSATKVILLPTAAGFLVDWGDGTVDRLNTHTYAVGGTKTVKMYGGDITGFKIANGGDKLKLTDVVHVGGLIIDTANMFNGSENLVWTATDTPRVTATNFINMFNNCGSFNGNINNWNTTGVTSFQNVFNGCHVYNQPLDLWDTSSATAFFKMFGDCTAFNQPVNTFDTSSGINMGSMFRNCNVFNQPVDSWDTSSATNMSEMLRNCVAFDQDVSEWDYSLVTNLSLFLSLSAFSQTNYDLLLPALDAQTLQSGVPFHAGTAKYGAGAPATARASIVGAPDLWTIIDGGPA